MPFENLDKMKVAELRAELAKMGRDTKGTRPILLARLKETRFLENSFLALKSVLNKQNVFFC